jgi:hypothetical protein
MWIRQFLTDIGRTEYIRRNSYTIRMYENNRFSIDLIKNAQVNERLKYINMAAYYIRELVARRQVKIKYLPTGEMIADCLIKSLAKD